MLRMYDEVRKAELEIMGFTEAMRIEPVMVKKMDAEFEVQNERGVGVGMAGDWKCEAADGRTYSIPADEFELNYTLGLLAEDEVEPVGFPAEVGVLAKADDDDDGVIAVTEPEAADVSMGHGMTDTD